MILLAVLCLSLALVTTKKAPEEAKPDWAKKDIRDYTEADLNRLLDQWEEDDEPIPVDELPDGHPDKPRAQIDLTKIDTSNPEAVLKASKKGQTVMMFVKVKDHAVHQDTEEVTMVWEVGMNNNHIQTSRTKLEEDRVMFLFQDGEVAWEARDWLLEQERCEEIQLEQQTYYGKYSNHREEEMVAKNRKKGKKEKTKKTEL